MASLKNGVLLKLLEDMEMDENALEDDPKPVLLQIRSIIPVLEEGDLWPNRGFFLKVSDSSHALYVSLSEEQNEMILGNKLKLGQFIYVQKLEKSHPVPLLRGVTPTPGRRPCEGTPEDIISPANLVNLLEASAIDDYVVEKGVILEKKISKKTPSFSRKFMRGLSDSESSSCKKSGGLKSRSLSASKARPREIISEKWNFEDFKKISCNDLWPRSRPSSVDNDSDADSVISSSSSSMRLSKRRSWHESEILGVKEIFDSSVVKHEIKLPPRGHSANVSPVRSVRYDSSDDNSSSISRRKGAGSAKRLIKSSNKSQAPTPKTNNVQISNLLCGLVYERKGAESGILWNSLPSNLVKYGKEVIRQRDIALLAAADALQEACASERLLNSLSTLSQFPLAEGDDLQPYVDKFFDLQDDLARTRLIMQSLTSISPFRTQETESCTTNSIKETLNIALERKKNAITWIKSAVALDLSPCAAPLDPSTNPMDPTTAPKKTSPSKCGDNKPKGACIIKKNKSNTDIPLILASVKEDQPDWTRGSTLDAGADLATSLQDECRKLFLSYVEKYLDEVDRKSSSAEYDDQMAGMMYKVKMVSDWLNVILNKEGKELEESEGEACERVRNKIYGILLKHVERTAMAFERLNTSL
ncbi:hypothetical protein DH2020_006533 [Rehmannia glutinosa]|uniref:Uncharacterized protein n=1 Tax=Rehmannia glutinosa TaxID=99300 RepID=A0ABR0XJG2_REHGL